MGDNCDTTYRMTVSKPEAIDEVFDTLCVYDMCLRNLEYDVYRSCEFVDMTMLHGHIDRTVFLENIAKVSKEYPDTIITIECPGDKFGDLFVSHFMNGEIDFYINDPITALEKSGIAYMW